MRSYSRCHYCTYSRYFCRCSWYCLVSAIAVVVVFIAAASAIVIAPCHVINAAACALVIAALLIDVAVVVFVAEVIAIDVDVAVAIAVIDIDVAVASNPIDFNLFSNLTQMWLQDPTDPQQGGAIANEFKWSCTCTKPNYSGLSRLKQQISSSARMICFS